VHQRQRARAIELNRYAFESRRETLGPHHFSTLDSLHNLAIALQRQGDLEDAERAYRDVLEARRLTVGEEHDRYGRVALMLGQLLHDQGKVDEARPLLQQAEAYLRRRIKENVNPDTANLLSGVLIRLGRSDEAISELQAWTQLQPESGQLQCVLADKLILVGRRKEAIAAYETAIDLEPDLAEAHSGLSNALREEGRLEDAIAASEAALHPNPNDTMYYNLGNALRTEGRIDEAITAYGTAIRLKPTFADAHNNLGVALGVKGRLDEAIAAFDTAIRLQPDSADAHNNLGNALGMKGRLDEAIAAFDSAIRLKPTLVEAHNALAWLLATCCDPTLRDPVRAVGFAQRAVDLSGGHPACWNTLGTAAYRAADYPTAIGALHRSIQLSNGGSAHDFFFLGMAQWKLAERDKARAWYEKGVAWMDANSPKDEELIRFRAEAEWLLDLPQTLPLREDVRWWDSPQDALPVREDVVGAE